MTSRRIWLRRAAAPFRGLEHHQTSGPVTRCPGLPGVVPAQWRGSPLQGSASFDKGSAQLTALTAAVFERTSITRAFPGSSLSHARRTDVVKKETEGRSGQHEGAPAQTREVQLGCVLTQAKAIPSAIRIPPPIRASSRPPSQFGKRLYREAWKRGWSRAEKKEGGHG